MTRRRRFNIGANPRASEDARKADVERSTLSRRQTKHAARYPQVSRASPHDTIHERHGPGSLRILSDGHADFRVFGDDVRARMPGEGVLVGDDRPAVLHG